MVQILGQSELSQLSLWVPAISALVGAAIGGTLLLFSDALRWRRNRSVRWEDKRREVYVAYLAALDGSIRETMDAVHPGNPSPEEAWVEARKFWQQASDRVNDIVLLAPQTVIDAGTNLLLAHQRFNDLLKVDKGVDVARRTFASLTQGNPANWKQIHSIPSSASDAFLAAARADINP